MPKARQPLPEPQYDVVWDLEASEPPGAAIASVVASKGYCTVRCEALQEQLSSASQSIRELDEEKLFKQLPIEVSDGLLGEEGSYKVCQLAPAALQEKSGLDKADDLLSELTSSLGDNQESLNLSLIGRSATLLNRSTYPKYAPPGMSEELMEEWIDIFTRKRLLVLGFLTGPRGVLELTPLGPKSTSVEVTTEPGMLAVLRAEHLQRKHVISSGVAHVCSTFVMCELSSKTPSTAFANRLHAWAEERIALVQKDKKELKSMSSKWRSWVDHIQLKGRQDHAAVRGMASHCVPAWESWAFWNACAAGIDTAIEVPNGRWDHTEWYDLDANVETWKAGKGKVYCMHGSFIVGAELFDGKFFKISNSEVKGMDPMQRHILDCGFEALAAAGQTKETLLKSSAGVYTATQMAEIVHVGASTVGQGNANQEGCAQQSAGTGIAGSIMANRFSFTFGMMGPSLNVDSEGSSSLVTVQMGMTACSSRKQDASLALCCGSTVMMSGYTWLPLCVAGELGRKGRCFTFDASAQGYMRGESTGALIVFDMARDAPDPPGNPPIHATIPAVAVSFSPFAGKVFTPSIAPTQDVIQQALNIAELAGSSMDALEAHGSGQQLYDIVEGLVAHKSLGGDVDSPRPGPLLLASTKSNTGNSRQSCNMQSLVKAIICGQMGMFLGGIHLRLLNPSLRDVCDEQVLFPTESVKFATTRSYVGVSGMGHGGTIAHGILQMDRDIEEESETQPQALEAASIAWVA